MEVRIEKNDRHFVVMVGDRYEFAVLRKSIQYKGVPGFTDVFWVAGHDGEYFIFFRQAVIFGIKQMSFNNLALAMMPAFNRVGM